MSSFQLLRIDTSFTSCPARNANLLKPIRYRTITFVSCPLLKSCNLLGMTKWLVCVSLTFTVCRSFSLFCLSWFIFLLDVIGHLVRKDLLKEHERNGRQAKYFQFTLEDLRCLPLYFIIVLLCFRIYTSFLIHTLSFLYFLLSLL